MMLKVRIDESRMNSEITIDSKRRIGKEVRRKKHESIDRRQWRTRACDCTEG